MDRSPPGSSVHGILQAKILEWVAIPFSEGSSWSRDQTQTSCIVGGFFTVWASREAHVSLTVYQTPTLPSVAETLAHSVPVRMLHFHQIFHSDVPMWLEHCHLCGFLPTLPSAWNRSFPIHLQLSNLYTQHLFKSYVCVTFFFNWASKYILSNMWGIKLYHIRSVLIREFTDFLNPIWDLPGGPVVKNPPANAGDTGSISAPGKSHMLWGS